MKYIIIFLLSLGTVFGQNILPKPEFVQKNNQQFAFNQNTTLFADGSVQDLDVITTELQGIIQQSTGIKLEQKIKPSKNQIQFLVDLTLPVEGYSLQVTNSNIILRSASTPGFFYGVQSLLQLLPIEVFTFGNSQKIRLVVDGIFVKDAPRFKYRGVMLDVSRHFFSASFVKKMIDAFSFYKINTLHWHLTDDQGWRIEIKKYPRLTEVGSIRKESMVGHYAENRYDGKPYGGFYTQEEIKDVVKYAEQRQITIIPEIEMPGHAMAALTAYPELGCTGGPYELRTKWGVEDHIFCPTEETFAFLQDVLTEVMGLFPSKYIHIGGDEAPKMTWENSKFCQDLIKREGLKDEHELQSYFIKRIDKFVTSKGRKIIGWDEILEGGLSPNATVMSWRGEAGGIEAANMGHDVIMTPNSHVYLDYYQGEPVTEPIAIGGYLPLETVYSYEPISPMLNKEKQRHILGVQGNLWTEYIETPEHVEYMYFPRIFAVAEIGWSTPKKDFDDFTKRVNYQTNILARKGINYSNAYLNVRFTTGKDESNKTTVSLGSVGQDGLIRYTTNGEEVSESAKVYDPAKPISVAGNTTIKAAFFSNSGEKLSKTTEKSFAVSKVTGLNYTLDTEPDKQQEKGKNILTDGQRGDANSQVLWSGFFGKDLGLTLDFGHNEEVSSVELGFLGDYKDWIQTPKAIEILVSTDKKSFKKIKVLDLGKMENLSSHVRYVKVDFEKTKTRYLRINAINQGLLPEGHPSAGNKSWIFIDEISVN